MNIGGSSWWDLQSSASYEVPAGSGKNSFFAGAFWIGAKDPVDALHVSAVRFRQIGEDYWPGPLNQNGEIDSLTCLEHDRIYKLNRWEVAEFRQRLGTVGYVIPDEILEWPANGNPFAVTNAKAPFIDVNGDGIYNATNGDYPAFAFDEPVDKDFHLLGDQCLWWVENDKGNFHTETNAEPMGVELQCMAYAFATCDPLNDQTFYRHKVINKSSIDYHDAYIGVWVDADVGYAEDDYVQCEVMRHLGFAYNGFEIDGTGGPQHYGAHPPAAGIGILEGPLAIENDSVDNDRDGIVDELGEHLMMSHFVYHNNTGGGGNPAQSDPTTGLDYYNYMRGIWLDGDSMCYGGNGHPSSGGDPSTPCDFMFPGDSDPLGYGTGGSPAPPWTEQTAGNVPFDRRFLVSSGPFNLFAGDTTHMHYSGLWARDTINPHPFAAADALYAAKDLCQEKFDSDYSDFDCCPPNAEIHLVQPIASQFLFSSVEEGDEYFWDFGNGATSFERFPPVHFYLDNGVYEVMLVVSNDCGSDTAYMQVSRQFFGINELNEFELSIYPNPATTNLTIESRTPLAQVWVRDVAGRAVLPTLRFRSGYGNIDVSSLPSGIYLVEVLTKNGQRSVQKVVVE